MELPNAIYLCNINKGKKERFVKVPFIRELKKDLKPKMELGFRKRFVLSDSLTGKELISWTEEI